MFGYDQACEYIERSASLGSRPGLERIRRLCDHLGNPEADLRFIHVAGTNGKGSTCALIASVLTEAGVHVGMYYSPAMTGIDDHYLIDGKPLSHDEYARAVSAVAEANEALMKEGSESATQFELETAMAFYIFSQNHCDAVILECGMGGRDDATNIVTDKICCVITSVSLDHMQYLGDTVEKIAQVKAGIITSDCPVIISDANDDVIPVVRKRCAMTGSALSVVGDDDRANVAGMKIALAGTFQKENAALAYRTLKVIADRGLIPGAHIDDGAIAKGFENVKWPFRFEKIANDPKVFVDGAHNPDAARKLRSTIESELEGYKIILVMGVFADKDYEKVVATLAGKAEMIFTVQTPNNARSLPASELAKCAKKFCGSVFECESIKDAYERAVGAAKDIGSAAVIACGSLSYLNDFREAAGKA